MPSIDRTNTRGRLEYLEAARKHWPELLVSLRESAAAPFAALMGLRSTEELPASYSRLCQQADHPVEMRDLCSALRKWASSHGIRDQWILDAAVQTLAQWWRQSRAAEEGLKRKQALTNKNALEPRAEAKAEMRWFYTPDDPGEFKPSFGIWLPALTRWSEFKKHADTQYRKQLQEYRQRVTRWWSIDSKRLPDQAIWTVLWQRGKSAGQIRICKEVEQYRRVNESTIEMGVRRFAAAIGLKLRGRQ